MDSSIQVARILVRSLVLLLALLVLSPSPRTEQLHNYIIATAQSHDTIEIIDPNSLATVGRIHVDLPSGSVGLNGASASADGKVVYVHAPLPDDPNGCCALYSIDLTSLESKLLSKYPGNRVWHALVDVGGVTYPVASLIADSKAIDGVPHISPDGRRMLVLNSGADIYDLPSKRIILHLALTHGLLRGDWLSNDQFVLYEVTNRTGHIWVASPDSYDLGAGLSIEPSTTAPGCPVPVWSNIVSSGGSLFVYENFGTKVVHEHSCMGLEGGAWLLDPASGRLLRQIAPNLHFAALIANHDSNELYGISVGEPVSTKPAELVRIDARSGTILQSRSLDSGYWYIAIPPLCCVPQGDARARLTNSRAAF